MDDIAIGRLFRELRVRLGWPQRLIAGRAGISRSAYSELEHGRIDKVPLRKLRKVADVLEVRLTLQPRWRGAEVDRIVSSRHTSMAERVARLLVDQGWEVRPEVSFNHFGERGVVDLVAFRAESRTLLLIELKTELADIGDLLTVTGRRRRLATEIGAQLGWMPLTVAEWVVVADSRTNHRRVASFRGVLRAAFPADGRAIPGWLARPARPMSALWFLPDSSASSARRRAAPRLRVRMPSPSVRSAPDAASCRPGTTPGRL